MILDVSEAPFVATADSVQAEIQIRTEEEKDFGMMTDTLFLSYFM